LRFTDAPLHLALFEKWHVEQREVLAPSFWEAEVVSVIRQAIYRNEINDLEGYQAVGDFFDLKVEAVPLDRELCQQALDWAAKIQHSRVYDALYLSLAERMNAEFWTADRKLAIAAQSVGAKWARWTGEAAIQEKN